MKKNLLHKLNRKVSMASIALITLSTLAGAASGVSAATTVPDTSTARKIEIHALNGLQGTSNVAGNNDGSIVSTLPSADHQALKNVGFSAIKIQPKTGYTVKTMTTDLSTYNTVGTAITGTTDINGNVTLNIGTDNTKDGYYLVHQTTKTDGMTATADFIVQVPLNGQGITKDGQWTYDINVYPKLDTKQLPNPDKFINLNDGTGTDKQASIFAGNTVTWNLTTTFPQSMRILNADGTTYTYGSAEFTDQLDSNLTYTGIDFSVAIQKDSDSTVSGIAKVALTKDTDYTISTTNGLVDLTLTNSGIDKVFAGIKGLGTLSTGSRAVFIPNITTKVATSFTSGQIGNSFTPLLTNAYGLDLNPGKTPSNTAAPTPGGPESGSTPDLYLGALTIKKVDSIDQKVGLQGAIFGIATTEANATSGDFIQVGPDGTLYATKEAATTAGVANTTDYTKTTDATGSATFGGLLLTDSSTNVTSTSKDYYVKETSAPDGYNLPNSVFKVTAGVDNTSNTLTNNLNGNNISLPFTGGQGMIGLVVVAGIAAGASLVIRRRRNSDED